MAKSEQKYELILLGYRNDLARRRTISFLKRLPEHLGASVTIHHDTKLPLTLFTDLYHAHGLELVASLRERGAQVKLRSSDTSALPNESTQERKLSLAPAVAVAAVGLMVVALPYIQADRQPALPPTTPLMSETQAKKPLAALRHHKLNKEAVELNAAGNFQAAAKNLRTAIDNAPRNEILQTNFVTVLRNWAVAEINVGRPDRAVEVLREAMQYSEAPEVLSLMGIAQQRLGAWQQAEESLQKAVRLGTSDPMTFVALGRVYRQRGDQQGAVEMFQRARESGAAGSDFETMLARLERELDAEWDFVDFSTPHFRFSFDQGDDRSAAHLVSAVLEDAYFSVGRKLDIYPTDPIEVVLYPSEDFHEVTQTPDWTGGVYDGRIKLPIRGVDGRSGLLERTLRHEYGHVLVTQISHGRVPVWLNEGLAIWAEEEEDGDREEWAHDTIAGNRLFTLRELSQPFTDLPSERVQSAYAQSYLAIRLILDEHGERRLLNLLRASGGGNSLDAAFQDVLSVRLADFESALIRNLTS